MEVIHPLSGEVGNFPALQAVLHEVDAIGCTEIISLGDIAGYYCMVNECIEALRTRDVKNLLGNHDHYLLAGKPCDRSRSATRCLEYQSQHIKEENQEIDFGIGFWDLSW